MRPRYKDLMLLAIVKGTHGKMSCHEIGMCCGRGKPCSCLLNNVQVWSHWGDSLTFQNIKARPSLEIPESI